MSYLQRKAFYDGLLTIYGRKPVMEALRMPSVEPYRLQMPILGAVYVERHTLVLLSVA